MTKLKEQFEELTIPRKELPKLAGRYRIYKDAKNYIVVDAESALEAFKLSGLQKVYRIERDAIYLNSVLQLDALSNSPAPAEKAAAAESVVAVAPASPPPAAVESPTSPAPAPAAEAPVADTPLSSNDVDKLLNSENATGAGA